MFCLILHLIKNINPGEFFSDTVHKQLLEQSKAGAEKITTQCLMMFCMNVSKNTLPEFKVLFTFKELRFKDVLKDVRNCHVKKMKKSIKVKIQ